MVAIRRGTNWRLFLLERRLSLWYLRRILLALTTQIGPSVED